MKKTLLLIIMLLSVFTIAPRAHAFTVRGGDNASVNADETIAGTLVIGGDSVVINGTVEGDLICAGKNVKVNGPVHGDILCAGQNIDVESDVDGSIRAASQIMNLNGLVGRNVTVAGQSLNLNQEAIGDVMAAGQNLVLNGFVGEDAALAGENIRIAASVEGNARIAAANISMEEGADISGDLSYTSRSQLGEDQTAGVGGTVTYRQPPEARSSGDSSPRIREAGNPWPGKVGSAVLAFLVTLAFLHFAKDRTVRTTAYMTEKPWPSMGWGFVILAVMPMVILMLVLTLIGIPLALLVAILFGIAVWMTRIFAAIVIGRAVIGRYITRYENDIVVTAGIGTILTYVLMWIPVVSFIFGLVMVLWGLGGWKYFLQPIRKTAK